MRKPAGIRKPAKRAKLNSFVSAVSDITGIDGEFIKTRSGFAGMLRAPGTDIINYQPGDQETAFQRFGQALQNSTVPVKMVFMDVAPNLEEQKNNIKYRMGRTQHPYRRELLARQMRYMEKLETGQRERMAYLLFFHENQMEIARSMNVYRNAMPDIQPCTAEEITQVTANLLGGPGGVRADESTGESRDTAFLKRVLPAGLQVYPGYLKAGGIYTSCLTAHHYPAYLADLTLPLVCLMPGTVVTIDIKNKARHEAIREIKDSMDELNSRSMMASSQGDALNDAYDMEDLAQLHASLQRANEQMLSMTLRFWVRGNSPEELQIGIETVKKEIAPFGIETYLPLNEMESEFRGLMNPADTVCQPIPIYETMSRQYPFYYQSHTDPHGEYFGATATNGQMILDTFRITPSRKSFDILLTGKKGSGKSAALKAMIQDTVAMGNRVMAMDVEGEMEKFAEKIGGKVIKLSPSARVNPLQLGWAVLEKEEGGISNFAAEISRLETFLYQYVPSLTELEAEEFKSVLALTYQRKGINEHTDISRFRPEQFPVFSDLLSEIRDTLYVSWSPDKQPEFRASLTPRKKEIYESLETYIRTFAEGVYAPMFNGPSTVSVADEDFIVFDVSALSEMSPRLYNAQLFNILSLIWNEICKNRMQNQNLEDERDRRFMAAVIDEAHRFINVNNPQGLDFIEKLARRSRKYDAGLWFANHGVRDMMPDDDSILTDKIKTVFSLIEYKMILQQDPADFPSLQKLFPQFTDSELLAAPSFMAGEMLLSMGGGKEKYHCFRFVKEGDFAYFKGGRE